MENPMAIHVLKWRQADVNPTDALILRVGAFFLDDIVTIRDLLYGNASSDAINELVKLYKDSPDKATAIGLKYLVTEGYITYTEADEIARRASYATDSRKEENTHIEEKNSKITNSMSGTLSPLNDVISSPGLHVILGASSSGKSRLLHNMSKELNLGVNFFSEPDHRTKGDAIKAIKLLKAVCHVRNKEASLFQHEFRDQKAEELLNDYALDMTDKLILIDSLKDILYVGGNLGRGGVSMSALSELSLLAGQLQLAGICVVTIVNPLRDDLLKEIMESLVGSVTGAWFIAKNAIECQYRFFNGEWYERRSKIIHLEWPADAMDELIMTRTYKSGLVDIEAVDEAMMRVPEPLRSEAEEDNSHF